MIYKVGEKRPPVSTGMHIKYVLVYVPSDYKIWRMGWFIGGVLNEWRVEGSSSEVFPTHWCPLPPLPTVTKKRKTKCTSTAKDVATPKRRS